MIGLLPITMALAGRRTEGGPPWRTLAAPLALAGTGLALVNGHALLASSGTGGGGTRATVGGALLALAAPAL